MVAGNRILITLSSESLEDSSLSTQQGGTLSVSEMASARTISSAKDHYGTGKQLCFGLNTFLSITVLVT